MKAILSAVMVPPAICSALMQPLQLSAWADAATLAQNARGIQPIAVRGSSLSLPT